MDKEDLRYTHTHTHTHTHTMEYYSARKKEWNKAICSNMDRSRDNHTKWSKSERERQMLYDITYMWNLKIWYKWAYLQNINSLTDIEDKFSEEERWGKGINEEFGSNVFILLHIK